MPQCDIMLYNVDPWKIPAIKLTKVLSNIISWVNVNTILTLVIVGNLLRLIGNWGAGSVDKEVWPDPALTMVNSFAWNQITKPLFIEWGSIKLNVICWSEFKNMTWTNLFGGGNSSIPSLVGLIGKFW